MVEYSPSLDRTFVALSDPTRRDILFRLRSGESTVTGIAAPYGLSLNAVSKHLRVLESAGLVRRRVEGRTHWLSVDAAPLADAAAVLDDHVKFWEERLEALARFVTTKKTDGGDPCRKSFAGDSQMPSPFQANPH